MWSMLRGTGRQLSSSSRSNAKVTRPKKSGPLRYGASTRFSNLYRTSPLGRSRGAAAVVESHRRIDVEFQNVPPSNVAPVRFGNLELAKDIVNQCLSKTNDEEGGVAETTSTTVSADKISSSSSPPPSQRREPQANKRPVLKIYTDGACSGNGQANPLAGSGVWFGHGDPRNISERLPGLKQTNIRAEMFAAIRALEVAPMDVTLALYIDCKYVTTGITEWVPNWIASGTLDQKENSDLWKRLIALTDARGEGGVQWHWVKGHSKNVGNDCADRLAVAGAKMRAVV